ncbi:MAG: hypothetical protein ABIP39_07175 [Polyangiaceae bacterium]
MSKLGHYFKGDLLGSYSKARGSRWSRRFGAARVAVFACVLGGFAILSSTHRAKADIGEAAMAIGRDLVPLADVLGNMNDVELNGEHIFMGSATSQQSVKDVLDRFQAHCAENPGPFVDVMKNLSKATTDEQRGELSKGLDTAGPGAGEVYRTETDGEGTLLCMTKGAKTEKNLKEAMAAFAKTRDLGSVGKLRYAYARKSKGGGTAVLTAWTEDSFNIDKLAPSDGSEPAGNDGVEVARPPSAKRVLNAQIVGTPYGVRQYISKESKEKLIAFYDADMAKKGWLKPSIKEHKDYKPELEPATIGAHLYTKASLQAIVQINAGDEAGQTSVAICELGVAGEEIVVPSIK